MKVEGYKLIRNVSLNQFGLFGYLLEAEKGEKKQYALGEIICSLIATSVTDVSLK